MKTSGLLTNLLPSSSTFTPGESTSDSDSCTGAVGVSSVGNTSLPVASPTVLSTTTSPIHASVVSTTSSATIVTTAPTVLRSQFDHRRPKQLQYAPPLAPLLDIINSAEGTAVEVADVNVWCEELVSALCLDSVQRRQVCMSTSKAKSVRAVVHGTGLQTNCVYLWFNLQTPTCQDVVFS